MEKKILLNRIDNLLSKIRTKHEELKNQQGQIPVIEADILLADILSLYELCKEFVNTPRENISTVPEVKKESQIKIETPKVEFASPNPTAVPGGKSPEENINQPFSKEQNAEGQKEFKPYNSAMGLFDEVSTVGDSFKEKETLHHRISEITEDKSVGTKLKKKPIKDLKAAIGINEKFIFLNELFEGNSEEYNSSIDVINGCVSFAEADELLKNGAAAKYKWNLKNKYVRNDFFELVQRRFL
jgi:hypothetical protein